MLDDSVIENKKELITQKEAQLNELHAKLARDEDDLQKKVSYLGTLREEITSLITSVEVGTKDNEKTSSSIKRLVAEIDEENKDILEAYRQEEINNILSKQPDFYSTLEEILDGKIESFNTGLSFETKADATVVVENIKRQIDSLVIDSTTVLLRETKKAFDDNLRVLCTRHVDKERVGETEKLYRIDMIHSLLNDSRIRDIWV